MITYPVFEESDYYKMAVLAVDELEEGEEYIITFSATGDGHLLIIAGGDSTNGDNYADNVLSSETSVVLTAENVSQVNAVTFFLYGYIDVDDIYVAGYPLNPLCDAYVSD